MKRIDLQQVDHNIKVGNTCGDIDANLVEDSILYSEGEAIGFYLRKAPASVLKYLNLANAEFLSDRVPKSDMTRASAVKDKNSGVIQYSTILGGVPPKPFMQRGYPTVSSVHNVKSASTFIKSMLLVCRESEKVVKELTPEIYNR